MSSAVTCDHESRIPTMSRQSVVGNTEREITADHQSHLRPEHDQDHSTASITRCTRTTTSSSSPSTSLPSSSSSSWSSQCWRLRQQQGDSSNIRLMLTCLLAFSIMNACVISAVAARPSGSRKSLSHSQYITAFFPRKSCYLFSTKANIALCSLTLTPVISIDSIPPSLRYDLIANLFFDFLLFPSPLSFIKKFRSRLCWAIAVVVMIRVISFCSPSSLSSPSSWSQRSPVHTCTHIH